MGAETIALISMYFAGISTFTGLAGLMLQIRKQNTFKVLRDGLQEIKEPRDGYYKTKEEDVLLDQWLSHASLIMPAFRQRLISRFLITLSLIVVTAFGVSLDTAGSIIPQIDALEWQDLILIPASIFFGLINNTSLMLKAEEKEFLLGLSSLQNIFYEEYVIPAMVQFNLGTKKLESFPRFRRALAREKRERERVEKYIAEYLNAKKQP